MADESGHAALRGFREGGHALKLCAAMGELALVAEVPGREAGEADAAVEGELRGALGGEFFDGAAEGAGIHSQAIAESVGGLEFGVELANDAVEVFDGRVVADEEALVDAAVGEAVQQDGAGGQPVASGAADFLVIGLDGAGQCGVDDGADVGLVDAHAKGDGGDDHLKPAVEEGALNGLAYGGVEAGMIGSGGEAAAQLEGQAVGGFARRSVDDGGTRGDGGEEFEDEFVAPGFGELDNLDGEVVAAEAMDEEGGVGEAKLLDDVLLDDGRSRGGEGDDGSRTQEREGFAEGAVIGAEVVAPAGNAVGFVDGDQRGGAAGEHFGEARDAQALGGDEEELEPAFEVVAAGLAGVVAGEPGVNAGYAEAGGGEFGGLVVHERDERADDDGGCAVAGGSAGEGGELVAEAFACAGGHDEKDVAARGEGLADGFLIFAEGGEAEGGLEEREEIHRAMLLCSHERTRRTRRMWKVRDYTWYMSEQESTGSLFGEVGASRGSGRVVGHGSGWITAYCDGGSRGNPGPAGYGVYIEGPDGEKLGELSEYLGQTTNNVAEYSALLAALAWALDHGRGRLRVVADSELMVKQMQGRYRVKSPDLKPLYEEAKRRVARLDGFRIEHVLRGKNQRADRLANLAMDRGMGRMPDAPGPGPDGPHMRSANGEPPKPLKGYTKGGVIHLIEGELPDGVFVKVTVDRQ